MMRFDVYDTDEELAAAAADELVELLGDVPVTFGLAGGSTPTATYRRLRDRSLPWQEVTCWLPDERWVPPEDPASNARTARRQLTDHVPAQLITPDTTLADPAEAAAAYQKLLEPELGGGPDVVLLGVGVDGHTASLFPGSAALDIRDPAYVANWVDELGTWRLTATAPLLERSKHVLFLVSGATKAPVMRRLLVEGKPLPAGLVAAGGKDVHWMLDAEAASEL
jgi:6-phosphogluconolactonase